MTTLLRKNAHQALKWEERVKERPGWRTIEDALVHTSNFSPLVAWDTSTQPRQSQIACWHGLKRFYPPTQLSGHAFPYLHRESHSYAYFTRSYRITTKKLHERELYLAIQESVLDWRVGLALLSTHSMSQTPTHVHWPNPYLNLGGRIQVAETKCELTS